MMTNQGYVGLTCLWSLMEKTQVDNENTLNKNQVSCRISATTLLCCLS